MKVTALGLVTIASALLLLAAGSYCVGRTTPTALRFLEPSRAPAGDEAFVAFPAEYALHSTEPNDVIFLGDSVCLHGLDPGVFQRLTGLKAFNLGSFGYIGPVGYQIVARGYLLNHDQKPRAVVLCVSALSFEIDPEIHGGTVPRRFEDAYGPEVGISGTPFARLMRIGSQSAMNRIFGAPDVRTVPLAGMERDTYESYERRWAAARGYIALPGAHGRAHLLGEFPEVARIRDDWDAGIRRLADECSAFHVPLLIRFAPLSTEFRQGRDYAPVERWAEMVRASHVGIAVAAPALEWYSPELSWDRVHLNAAGVEKFMPVVAADVQAALSRP